MQRPWAEAEDNWRAREKQSGFPRNLELSTRGRHCHLGPYPWTEETRATCLSEPNGSEKIPKADDTKSIETTIVTTKTLASDGGLEELLKKIGGVSLDHPLVILGATEQPLSVPLERFDNNPQVFLGTQEKKGGECFLCKHWNLRWIRWGWTRNWWEHRYTHYSTWPKKRAKSRKYFIIYVGCRKRVNIAQAAEYRK